MTALEVVLLDRAAAHVPAPAPRFVCPDCDGDPACPTCGEPTRELVLSWMQRVFRRWLR